MASNATTTGNFTAPALVMDEMAMVEIVVPLAVYAVALCIILYVRARAIAYRPMPPVEYTGAGLSGPRPPMPPATVVPSAADLFADERYMAFRARLLTSVALIWAVIALIMVSAWSVLWTAGMYVVGPVVGYLLWKAFDSARLSSIAVPPPPMSSSSASTRPPSQHPPLNAVFCQMEERWGYLAIIVWIHFTPACCQLCLLLGRILWKRRFTLSALHHCTDVHTYIQFAYALLCTACLVILTFGLFLLPLITRPLSLAYSYYVYPMPSSLPPYDTFKRDSSSSLPYVLQRHRHAMQRPQPGGRGGATITRTVYLDGAIYLALEKEQMALYLTGVEPDYAVPRSYEVTEVAMSLHDLMTIRNAVVATVVPVGQ